LIKEKRFRNGACKFFKGGATDTSLPGKHSNMTLKSFIKLITALGGEVTIRRGKEYIPIKLAA
jgi:hypothetical protein